MTAPIPSYEKVFYDLRPAKQVERRMLIDVLQRLQAAGAPIRSYRYTGMGSVYFVDFILFHRLLGLSDMLSVEINKSITKRVQFNVPFRQVRVQMGPIGDAIAELDQDKQHILWLDYDGALTEDMVQDIRLAGTRLTVGSVFLVTIDLEVPDATTPGKVRRFHEESAGDYFELGWEDAAFAPSELPRTLGRIVERVVRAGMTGRNGVTFEPVFSFVYKDGHEMLTVGGVMSSSGFGPVLQGAILDDLTFVRRDWSQMPFRIHVPRLTRKERLHLDQRMPLENGWIPTEFEISADHVADYSRVYRYYPNYAELLL